MECKEVGGRKVPVKESIRYISELITGLGVTGITPENLRLAKFNKLETPECLLRALHDLVTFYIACFPENKNVTKSRAPSPASSTISWSSYKSTPKSRKEQLKEEAPPALESVCEGSLDGDVLGFVKFHLALWGYPPHSPFFTLHADTQESRHFLLALGWIISHWNLIERGLERRLQPLLADRSAAPLPNEFPLDMASSPEALARAKKAECAALDYVRRMIAATDGVDDEVLRTEMRADQALMLYGQVRTCLNAIETLRVTKVNKLHELQLAQLAAGMKQPHTPYELHLLQHRKKLDLHCRAIAAAKAIEEENELCGKHEGLFWQWMESVAHETLAAQMQSKSSPIQQPCNIDLKGVTEAELLPAIEHLKQKLAACDRNVEGGASSPSTLPESFKRNASIVDASPNEEIMLPQNAKDLAKGLLRQPVFVYSPKKKPETRTLKAALRNDEENDPQSALYKIKSATYGTHWSIMGYRLREVDEMVKGILAITRGENKAAILEILKPIMEDESYVVVGF